VSVAPTLRFCARARPWSTAAALALTALTVVLSVAVRRAGADERLFLAVNGWRGLPDVVWAVLGMAGLGLTGLVVALLLAGHRPRLVATLPWMFLVGGGLTQVVKQLYRMPRPVSVLGAGSVHVIGKKLLLSSMPSGHALTAVAVVCLLWLEGGPLWRRPWIVTASVVVATAICFSRIATGAHFPADLLAGATLGWATACVSVDLARRTRLGERLSRPSGEWAVGLLQVGTGVALIFADTGQPGALPVQLGLGAAGALAGVGRLAGWIRSPGPRRPEAEA
jgi:membrane-associated phospholipid phosphatase